MFTTDPYQKDGLRKLLVRSHQRIKKTRLQIQSRNWATLDLEAPKQQYMILHASESLFGNKDCNEGASFSRKWKKRPITLRDTKGIITQRGK